jgi:hypothetical protein
MQWRPFVAAMIVAMPIAAGSAAHAQPAAPADLSPWSVDAAIGWDNSISGNINSSGIGQINNQSTVITKNTYDAVYGTGLHFKFGGGYMLDEETEIRVGFTFQSLDADLTPMGDIGASRLYGQYADYQSLGLDAGLRRYMDLTSSIRAYGEGTIGLAIIDETDVILVAPAANLSGNATDFYDKTAAFALGGNAGVLVQTGERIGIFGQIGLRWVSGMSAVDGLAGTGLETINDKSSRWTFPFIAGLRVRF